MTSSEADALLEARALRKSFDGNVVLSDVALTIRAGEVHAIVGENGAGKSTLIKILSGVYRPDGGKLFMRGKSLSLQSPRDALEQGIVVIHQELSLAPHLSAEENIFLGHFPRTTLGFVDRASMKARTREVLERLSIGIDQTRPVGELSIAQQQMVEIAKAISTEAKVLILDEPTAVLDANRVDTLFDLIGRLKSDGLGIVFISHHLEEVFRIADTVTVLRDGSRTGFSPVREIDQNWLVDKMIGREFPVHNGQARQFGAPALQVDHLTLPGSFSDISFSVSEGEIVGLAGLVGAGRTEIARAIVGLARPSSGSVRVFGRPVRIRNPAAAAGLGIAYVSEDRKTLGLLPNRSVRDNATLSNLSRFRKFGFLNLRRETAYVRDMVRRLDIRLPSLRSEIRTLSGGNQQKVLIGRALAVEPRILILDEPTRGVDIGAKGEIYALIEQLVANGVAILLISSEMEEVLRLSDRVVVLRSGGIAASLPREQANEASIMRAATLAN